MAPLTSEIAIFAGVAPSKSLFLAFKVVYKSMFFQPAFENDIFSNFYIKNVIFGVQVGPQLGVKNLHFFMIFVSGASKTQWEPQKPPKACPGRLQELPKASKMSFWTSKICTFLPQGY